MTLTDRVIDLRDSTDSTEPTAADRSDAGTEPEVEEGPNRSDHEPSRTARAIVVLVLLGLVALLVADMVIGAATHAEHQRHLASEYGERQADLAVGDASYVLQIPSVGLNEVVVEGASPTELRGGPGRRLDSAVPGEPGNTVVQGTSVRFGGPFGPLEDVVAGKTIYLRSRSGEVFRYKVTKVQKAADDDQKFLDVDGPDRLTLVSSSSHPLSGERRVVIAVPDTGVAQEEEPAVDTEGADGAEPAAASAASEQADGPVRVYDVRGLGQTVLLLCGLALMAIGLVAASGLRRRYRVSTVAVVAGSSVALGVVLISFNISAFIPTTY